MNSFSTVFAICVITALGSTTGFQWIPLKVGDPIPENAIKLDPNENAYVGRARHYNLIIPATVYDNDSTIYYNEEILAPKEYEVLIATEHCEWRKWTDEVKTTEMLVRAGSEWNHEPTFIGKSRSYSNVTKIVSIHLSSTNNWSGLEYFKLLCVDKNTWIDASSTNIPNNTIEQRNIGIARLIGPYAPSYVPAGLDFQTGMASSKYLGVSLYSPNYQVLVGESSEYSWIISYGGVIPEFAVVVGQNKQKELIYVGRKYSDIIPVTFSEASVGTQCEILVKNTN